MNNEKIIERIKFLESKQKLNGFETKSLARNKELLANPEIREERYKKAILTKTNRTPEQKQLDSRKRTESLLNKWKELKKDEEFTQKRNKKISESSKGKIRSKESIEKQKESVKDYKFSDERKKSHAEARDKQLEKIDNFIFLTKHYNINGVPCQGKNEKWYMENLIAENKPMPIKKKFVMTPFGSYHPDFEFEDKYVEIKSGYTYKIFIGEISPHKNTPINTEQYKKVVWTGKNVKPVQLLVIDLKSGIELEILFDKDYIDNLEYIPKLKTTEKLSKEERARIAKETGEKQRGSKRPQEEKDRRKKEINERKEKDPEAWKEIYIRRSKNNKIKLESLTEEEKIEYDKKQELASIKRWETMRKDEEKLNKRNETIRNKNKDKVVSEETKKKISDSTNKQWENMSDEEKERRRQTSINVSKNRIKTDEEKERISKSNKEAKRKFKEENPELYQARIEKMRQTKLKNNKLKKENK